MDGKKIPKVCCKAYPDREKDFNNLLSEDMFEDAYFNIKEKWQNDMFDLEAKTNNYYTNFDFEPDANEG